MTVDPGRNSRCLFEGPDRPVALGKMKAIGFTDETLAKPQIGVAHCWIGRCPYNWNHRKSRGFVAEGVREEGGTPIEVNTVAINVEITTGTEGMNTSLVSRDLIANSVELVARARQDDSRDGHGAWPGECSGSSSV